MKRYIAIAIFSQFFLCSQSLGKRDKHAEKTATPQASVQPAPTNQTIVYQPADPIIYQQMVNALQQASLMQQLQMQQEQQTSKKSSEEAKFVAAAVSAAANLFLCMITKDPQYIGQMFKEAALVIGRRVHVTIDDEEIVPESINETSVPEQAEEMKA